MKITVIQDIRPIICCLNGFGINFNLDSNRTFKQPIRFLLLLFGTLMWAMALYRFTWANITDVDALVPAMTLDVQVVLLLFKVFTLLIMRRKRFLRLNEAFERLALRGNQSEREIWNNKNRFVISVSKFYFKCSQLTVAFSTFVPIVKLIYYYLIYKKVVYTLPLPGIFPFDYTHPFNFALIMLFIILFSIFSVCCVISVDCIFFWFVYNVSAHFQIMQLKLERLVLLNIDESKFQMEFAALVTYHHQILVLSAELNDLYTPVIFMAVTCSCLPLCFLVYQLSCLSDPAFIPFASLLFSSIVLQLVMYCFGGGKVQDDCDQLCTAIYLLVPWERLPPKQSRMCLMPLIRCQRDLVLSGYFFTANRSLLVWIFRTTGSILAMLFALRKKE